MTWSSRDELGRLLRRYADAVVAADRAITNYRAAAPSDLRVAAANMSEAASHADAMYDAILERFARAETPCACDCHPKRNP